MLSQNVPDYFGLELCRLASAPGNKINCSSNILDVDPPCFRFHTPLIEPDVRISRFRLSAPKPFISVTEKNATILQQLSQFCPSSKILPIRPIELAAQSWLSFCSISTRQAFNTET